MAAVEAGSLGLCFAVDLRTSDLDGVYLGSSSALREIVKESLSIKPRVVRRYEVPWGASE